MQEKFDKFIPNKNKEPVCEVCGGLHKTSRHAESLLEKTEMLNPVCDICKGGHKTSRHDEYEAERVSRLNPIEDKYARENKISKIQDIDERKNKLEEPICEICKGPHKTSHHPFESKDKIK